MGAGRVPEDPWSGEDTPGRVSRAADQDDDCEPAWLGEDAPLDPDGDERDWPGNAAEVTAQAEADGAEHAAITARLIAAGFSTADAHVPGAPVVPGIADGPGGGFGQGQPLDVAVPTSVLSTMADYASGPERLFNGVNDDELFGLVGARSRLTSRQDWELLTAVAELIRRRPAPGCELRGPARMPGVWAEGTAGELSVQLAVTTRAASGVLDLAWDLAVKLPLTSAALRDGVIDRDKAAVIARCCSPLTAAEAMRAEAILFALPGIGQMTWSMIRDRILRAAVEVNPEAARKRREQAAKDRRVEVYNEESGNMAVCGREMPAVASLKIDAKIKARARQFKTAGVPGGTDELRALAFLERWGEADPLGDLAHAATAHRGRDGQDEDQSPDDRNGSGNSGDDPSGPRPGAGPHPGAGPRPGTGPAGPGGSGCTCGAGGSLPAVIHLTAPAATLMGLAERPGTLRGAGPVDPAQLRDLADATAGHPATTFCFTLTDNNGRPAAHACGKPARTTAGSGPGPPRLTMADRGPPGSRGTWRYTYRNRVIMFTFENLDGECDHRFRAKGHDPGKMLRHLTGILNPECTFATCRTPDHQSDYEHSIPTDQGGITCLCACGPVCRRNHQNKQQTGWKIRGTGKPGEFTWTMPSGRTFTTHPAIYPT